MNNFYSFNQYIIDKFKKRVWRLPLSTGFPCPNRLNGKTGCAFCSEKSFLPRYLKTEDTLENQITRGIAFFGNRYKVDFFYGYFQENTGTYGDKKKLLEKYKIVLSNPQMIGLIISTRPDHINNEIISDLNKLNRDYNKDIWIELGLQSVYDETLKRINRGHSYADFKNSVSLIKNISDFKITAHMIAGLPGESPQMIKNSVKQLFDENKIDGIKLRLLEIIKDTSIEKDFLNNKIDFFIFDIDSYAKLVSEILKIIPENVVIMRLVNFKSLQILNAESKIKISKNKFLEIIKEKN